MTTATPQKKEETKPAAYTITISGLGKPVTAELSDDTAQALRTLAELLPMPTALPPPGKSEQAEEASKDFTRLVKRLANLHPFHLMLVSTLIDLMEFGTPGMCSEDNWIWEVVQDSLRNCMWFGIADALAYGPATILASMATSYSGFRSSMDDLRKAHKYFSRALAAETEQENTHA